MENKPALVNVLRSLLTGVFSAQVEGGNHQKLVRAFGYADGYMRAVLEAGIVSQKELLTIVQEERTRMMGSGSAELPSDALAV
jgi:hypothetical protein